uniref:Uncharacterized protein n=1 Tax=Leersia perrieri TaxID=77586 RepID=A0A0D9UZR8_9ORYZ
MSYTGAFFGLVITPSEACVQNKISANRRILQTKIPKAAYICQAQHKNIKQHNQSSLPCCTWSGSSLIGFLHLSAATTAVLWRFTTGRAAARPLTRLLTSARARRILGCC